MTTEAVVTCVVALQFIILCLNSFFSLETFSLLPQFKEVTTEKKIAFFMLTVFDRNLLPYYDENPPPSTPLWPLWPLWPHPPQPKLLRLCRV